ncbi:hypothetical protein MTO96_025462 [Rhipicephalus appendiculatus]
MSFSLNTQDSGPLVRDPTRGAVTWTESETSSGWSPPWDLCTGLLPISAQEEDAAQRQPQHKSKLILVPVAVVTFLVVSAIAAALVLGYEMGSNSATSLETSDSKADGVDSDGLQGKTVGARLITTADDSADIYNISSTMNASMDYSRSRALARKVARPWAVIICAYHPSLPMIPLLCLHENVQNTIHFCYL